jgi:hypothetical protein
MIILDNFIYREIKKSEAQLPTNQTLKDEPKKKSNLKKKLKT